MFIKNIPITLIKNVPIMPIKMFENKFSTMFITNKKMKATPTWLLSVDIAGADRWQWK